MLLGVLGGRIGFDFRSKIGVNTGIADFPESMLSPAWEQRFSRSEGLGGHILDTVVTSEGRGR